MKKLFIIISVTILTFNSLYAQSGWISIYSELNSKWESNFFNNVNTGYVVGGKAISGWVYPRILKTTNAGNNWFEQTSRLRDTSDFFNRCVIFTDMNTGFGIAFSATFI